MSYSQEPCNPGDPGCEGGPGGGEPVPIQGVGLLLVAGAAYGIKKLADSNRQSK